MTNPDCPHCDALRIQPGTYTVGWWCPTHGDVSYDPTARIRALEAEREKHVALLRLAHAHLTDLDERLGADLARGGMGVNILAEHRQSLRTLLRRIERAAGIPTGQEAP